MDRWASQAPTDGNKLVCSSRNWHQGLVNCDRPILTVGSFFTSVVNYFEIINVLINYIMLQKIFDFTCQDQNKAKC